MALGLSHSIEKTVKVGSFVFFIGGRRLSYHISVMCKRVLCGDKNSRVWRTLDVSEVVIGCPGKVRMV